MTEGYCERHLLKHEWTRCPCCLAAEYLAKELLPHILSMQPDPVPMNAGPTPVPTTAGTAAGAPASAGVGLPDGWHDGRRPDTIDHCGGCRLRMMNGRVRWESGQIIGFLCHPCAKKEGFGG